MCGIIGIASQSPINERQLLIAQRDTMYHRGPDDAGIWWSNDGRVGLAHRRLAILDLSPAGHQPMQDETGDLSIVFNGEIYNFKDLRRELEAKGYTFRSNSDTEVILEAYRAWGLDCLTHFNGMFAFGIYDAEQRRIFLARDRAGEKPLFYRSKNGSLYFASELKALMTDPTFPRRLDPEALDCYLAFGYVPDDRCILHGVNKLPPAHALSFGLDSGESRVWRYWQLPEPPCVQGESIKVDEVALLEELEDLLQDSVKRQLVADVPVGILLSGGVDSSLTTAMAARSASKVKTFTIRFPGHGKYDETEHARLIANHFGTEHIELEAESSEVELLQLLARQFDEPMVDSSMLPTYLVSKLVHEHCKVALGGDGGDELFGGYTHYKSLLWLKKYLGWVPLTPRKSIGRLAARALPLGLKGRNWLEGLGTDFERGLPFTATYFGPRERRALLGNELDVTNLNRNTAENIRLHKTPQNTDLLQRATRMDFENGLPEDILVKVDRCSMMNSLEIRAPWLDYRVVEFAFRKTPSSMKTSSTDSKILPKMLARKILPRQFDTQRKQGFSIPLGSWLKKEEWKHYFRQVLLDSKESLFSCGFVSGLLANQTKGYSNSERLFGLVMFNLWAQEYKITF